MMTSNFAKLKQIEAAGLTPVSISRGTPQWFTGIVELRLAPTWQMLKIERSDYDVFYQRMLAGLDPKEVFEAVGGDKAVLLCWESGNVWCHRRAVAEWFEKSLGIEVTEFGLDRCQCIPYQHLPSRKDVPRVRAKPKPVEVEEDPQPRERVPDSFDLDYFGAGNSTPEVDG